MAKPIGAMGSPYVGSGGQHSEMFEMMNDALDRTIKRYDATPPKNQLEPKPEIKPEIKTEIQQEIKTEIQQDKSTKIKKFFDFIKLLESLEGFEKILDASTQNYTVEFKIKSEIYKISIL